MENGKNSKAEKAGFGYKIKGGGFDFMAFEKAMGLSLKAKSPLEPIVYRKVVHSRLVCLNGRIYNLGTFNSRDAAERAVADFNSRKQASIKEKLKNFFGF